MESNVDTTPIPIKVPGVLNLDVMIRPQSDGDVRIDGVLGFALSKSVESAISFLPPLIRWGLSAGLVHKELRDRTYRFKVANLTTIDTTLNEAAVLVLTAKYHSPLAKPVGKGETERVFRRFGKELQRSGLTPHSDDLIEQFLQQLNRQDRGELAFLHLFEGRAFVLPDRSTPRIVNLRLERVVLKQDSQGDLLVEFDALGKIDGYEERLAG